MAGGQAADQAEGERGEMQLQVPVRDPELFLTQIGKLEV